jgi:hypothetical protein
MKTLTWKKEVKWLTIAMIFGIFWLLTFIENISNFIVMVAASTYYYNNSPATVNDQRPAEVCTAISITYCSHLGSVAIGSLLIAIIRFIKWTFVLLAQQMEKSTGENAVTKCMVKVALCIISCLEKITEYITDAAFCYIAVTGDNFCYGAYCAFILQIKHLGEFAWSGFLAKMFIVLGKVAVIAGNVVLYCLVLSPLIVDKRQITSMITPALIVGFVTWIMASIFLDMLSMSAEAMMTCYAIDYDFNNEAPQFGSATFHDGLNQKRTATVEVSANTVE